MKHIKALLIKFLVIGVVLYSILAIFHNASVTNIFLISLLVTGISYFIGDLIILPRFGNVIATISDFGLSFLTVWILGAIILQAGVIGLVSASLLATIFITCCEAIFHIYMQNRVLKNDDDIYIVRNYANEHFQTEFSEEHDVQDYIKLHDDSYEEKD